MEIKLVLFDLGNVLVQFSHKPIARALARRATKKQFKDPLEVSRYLFASENRPEKPFDRGEISAEAFFQEIRAEMGLELDFEAFSEIWNPIFKPREGCEDLVRFMHGQIEMHLLSNTNALHFPWVLSLLPWLRLLDSWILSYEVGCMKPSPAIYQEALRRAGRPPEKILFLDDLEENLRPARELGIRAVHVNGKIPLKELLRHHLPFLSWERFGREA